MNKIAPLILVSLTLSNSSLASLPPDFFGLSLNLEVTKIPVNDCLNFSKESACQEAKQACPNLINSINSEGGLTAYKRDARKRGNQQDLVITYEAEEIIQQCSAVDKISANRSNNDEPDFDTLAPIADLLLSSYNNCASAVKNKSNDAMHLCVEFVSKYEQNTPAFERNGGVQRIIDYPVNPSDDKLTSIQSSLTISSVMYKAISSSLN